MRQFFYYIYLITFVVFPPIFLASCDSNNSRPVTLKINSNTKYQTMEGWGATLGELGIPFNEWLQDPTLENYDKLEIVDPIPAEIKAKIMDDAVFKLGLTRFRLKIGPQVELQNDNDDPNNINFDAFRFKWQDAIITKWVLPLKQRIEKNGEKLVLYISYDLRSKLTPSWLLGPEEYAEMAVATLTHFKKKHGLEPDYWSVLNGPGNDRPGNPELVAQLIRQTGKSIKQAGFRTRMSGPEIRSPKQITDYMKALKNTPGALEQLGQLTYHLYGGHKNIKDRNRIRKWANKLGITTAQTEWPDGKGLEVVEAVYLDLVEANASVWEQYDLFGDLDRHNRTGGVDYFVVDNHFSDYYMNMNSWYLGHFMAFVRPGDVRIYTSSSNPQIKPVAFLRPDGTLTIIVINSSRQDRDIRIKNLLNGTYNITFTDPNQVRYKMPQQQIDDGEYLTFTMPEKGIVTFQSE